MPAKHDVLKKEAVTTPPPKLSHDNFPSLSKSSSKTGSNTHGDTAKQHATEKDPKLVMKELLIEINGMVEDGRLIQQSELMQKDTMTTLLATLEKLMQNTETGDKQVQNLLGHLDENHTEEHDEMTKNTAKINKMATSNHKWIEKLIDNAKATKASHVKILADFKNNITVMQDVMTATAEHRAHIAEMTKRLIDAVADLQSISEQHMEVHSSFSKVICNVAENMRALRGVDNHRNDIWSALEVEAEVLERLVNLSKTVRSETKSTAAYRGADKKKG